MELSRRLPGCSWLCVASFTLRTDDKDQDDVDQCQVSIQRHVPVWSIADQQFPLVIADWTTDEGVVRQYIQRADDPISPGLATFDFVPLKRGHDPIEVVDDTGSEPDAWHLIDPACAAAGASTPPRRDGP